MTTRINASLCCGILALTVVTVAGQPHFSNWSTPVNLGPVVNSADFDQHPAMAKDGLSLFFVSTRPGGIGGFDLYVSHRAAADEPWGMPINLGPGVNSADTENAPTLSRDGHLLFFGSNRSGGCGGLDIWVSYRAHTHDDFGWGPPQNLGCAMNTAYDEDGPTHFSDELSGVTTLYFASLNRPGNIGDWDIYASTLQTDGTFGAGTPVPGLNSSGRDTRTSISRDGRTLYITSNRSGGLGGLDLWVATRPSTTDPWSMPQNVGAPVNTAAGEGAPAVAFDDKALYFWSNRSGGVGGVDLYLSTRSRTNAAQQ
jgi:WD40-like Beta Propeller Repeat